MCDYNLKSVLLLENYNIFINSLIQKYTNVDDNFVEILDNVNIKLQCNNSGGCKNLYKVLKSLYNLLQKKYDVFIKCDEDVCTNCENTKHKLKYIKNNINTTNFIRFINVKYINKYNEYEILSNDIINHLQNNNLPLDVINNEILTNIDFKCEYKQRLLYLLKDTFKYSFNMNLLLKNKLFRKYFRLDKICQFTNTCQNCKLLFNLIDNILDIIQYKKIKYKTCSNNMDFELLYEYGFSHFRYNNSKYVTLDDFDIIPMLEEVSEYDDY